MHVSADFSPRYVMNLISLSSFVPRGNKSAFPQILTGQWAKHQPTDDLICLWDLHYHLNIK